jgi:hypothetical protein
MHQKHPPANVAVSTRLLSSSFPAALPDAGEVVSIRSADKRAHVVAGVGGPPFFLFVTIM